MSPGTMLTAHVRKHPVGIRASSVQQDRLGVCLLTGYSSVPLCLCGEFFARICTGVEKSCF